jgi:hypothetical protein
MFKSTLVITLHHDHRLDKTDARAIVAALNEDEFIGLVAGDTVAGVSGGKVSIQALNTELEEDDEDEFDEEGGNDDEDDNEDEDDNDDD